MMHVIKRTERYEVSVFRFPEGKAKAVTFGYDDGVTQDIRLAGICNQYGITNIEIYDYIHAYESLQFSTDNTIVYNPTLVDVWLETDNHVFCIKSGERQFLDS